MPGYVITSVFEVTGGKLPLGQDVLAGAWGPGHRFSYCDGRMLTLVAEVTAADVRLAFEAMLGRAESVWQVLGQEPLGPPVTLRVQGAVEESRVAAGLPPDDDRSALERARAAVVARLVAEHTRPRRGDHGEEPPDDGGLAGVREPRRPRPGPPGLAAALDVPDAPGL